MKKLCLISLLVVGFSFQYGNSQTGYLGEGKLVGNSDKHISERSNSGRARPAAVEFSTARGIEKPKSNETADSRKDYQFDSATKQMVEESIDELSKQSENSLQDSVRALITANTEQDHDIMNAISESGQASVNNSSTYSGRRNSNDMFEILTPYLAADRESLARELIESLLHYDVTLDIPSRIAAQ
jgi:hypothetical protein